MSKKKRVVVAMSGGVDSSVTAAVLKEQGYDIIGVTMQVWDNDRFVDDPNYRGCCSLSAVGDARRVCDVLEIPHYVLNFRPMFKETVVDYFIAEYAAGRTPNPCIACNRYVKFEGLLQKALELEGDFVATGHYARIQYDDSAQRYQLLKGIDHGKDQSYALYNLTQETLARFLMPIGHMNKTVTREIARKFHLPVAEKPDSQEICFIPDDDYKAFLHDKSPEMFRSGDIVDIRGKVLGKHEGIGMFTVGQRKGLGIATGKPVYVVEIDALHNRVVVGSNDDLFAKQLVAKDLNFIMQDTLREPLAVTAKIRYSAPDTPATLYPLPEGKVCVAFEQPQRAITPGQSVVFYDGEKVVGGGVIEQATHK